MIGFASCANPDGETDKESSAPESTEKKPESSKGPESKPDREELIYIHPLTDAEKYMIERDWKQKNNEEELVWFDKDAAELDYEATRYYGVFDGYQIIFKHIGWEFDYKCGIELAGEMMAHDQLFEVYAYKNGQFYNVVALYESEKLNYYDALIIADTHERFENYIKNNSAK